MMADPGTSITVIIKEPSKIFSQTTTLRNLMKMHVLVAQTHAFASMASDASASDVVSFPGITVTSTVVSRYVCKDKHEVTVSYINASNGDSFATLPIDGTPHVFVSVLSGSGVRYASGRYIWWNKGNTGMLLLDGDDTAPPLLADCVSGGRGT
jgi:membrane-bound inhibitor of C-type lysozyme